MFSSRDTPQRRFPRNDDQLSPLFQMHVGGPLDQVGRQPVGDAGQRAHRTRADHHAAVMNEPLAIGAE